MKIKYFGMRIGHYGLIEKEINEFIKDKHVIDIKVQTDYSALNPDYVDGGMTAVVMYEKNPIIQVKYFNEVCYKDTFEVAVNEFCKKHNVLSVDTKQDSDDYLVTTVTYKE